MHRFKLWPVAPTGLATTESHRLLWRNWWTHGASHVREGGMTRQSRHSRRRDSVASHDPARFMPTWHHVTD
jgi:hypothetical protein